IAPFLYSWNAGSFTTQANYITAVAGTNTCIVTDANGCSAQTQLSVVDSCDLVWPGDANDDLIADNNDLLAIALGNSTNGTARNATGIFWNCVPSVNWGNNILGSSDNKHIDCDGNGNIDLNDTNAVVQNFNLTHAASKFANPQNILSAPDLKIDILQDTLAAGVIGNIMVSLGDNTNPANNIYGVAFTLNFDPAVIDPSSFRINGTGSWMGMQNNNMLCISMNDGTSGMMQGVVARYDHSNVSGNGLIANMAFNTKSNYSGTQNVNFSLSNITLIDAAGIPMNANSIGDSLIALDPLTLGMQSGSSPNIKIFPNPFSGSTTFLLSEEGYYQLKIYNVVGGLVDNRSFSASSFVYQNAQLEGGVYFYEIRNEAGSVSKGKLIYQNK
ncbi:MAG: T9SS type A sorting domain-containing protein, partial [Bacteroidia bacterium]|nr:T9SS type A sorting domain-containing protein [Bacteroidia bacterium]